MASLPRPTVPQALASTITCQAGPHPHRDADCMICQEVIAAETVSVEHSHNLPLTEFADLPGIPLPEPTSTASTGCLNRWHANCFLSYLNYQADSQQPMRCPLCREDLVKPEPQPQSFIDWGSDNEMGSDGEVRFAGGRMSSNINTTPITEQNVHLTDNFETLVDLLDFYQMPQHVQERSQWASMYSYCPFGVDNNELTTLLASNTRTLTQQEQFIHWFFRAVLGVQEWRRIVVCEEPVSIALIPHFQTYGL